MNQVSVIIPTFGDDSWRSIASRATASAISQSVECAVIRKHCETLQEARNQGAEDAETEWIIFLDADDELDHRYVEAMLDASGDIRRPATLGIVNGIEDDEPVMIPKKDIKTANYIVIGAMCRRDDFLAVGGFDDYECLEDWDLWLKMIKNGAEVVDVPNAIYRVHVTPNSRNSNVKAHHEAYRRIRRKHHVH